MAPTAIGLRLWLGMITALWTLYPLLFSQARGLLFLTGITGLLALIGWLTGLSLLVVWSGGLGLCNLTLALLLAAPPPRLWTGLGAGLLLLALLDGHQRFAYLRQCQWTPSVLRALFGPFVVLSSLSLLVGTGLGLVLILGDSYTASVTRAGLLSIGGAGLFAGFLAIFLAYGDSGHEQ